MKIFNVTRSADGRVADITIYGDISNDWWGDVTARDIAFQLEAVRDVAEVHTHINSNGGDMFAGIAIYNMLEAIGDKVTSHVEGIAGSAASVIAMAGKKTVMGTGSMLMVHNPWSMVAGEAKDLRAAADMLDKAQLSLIAVYQKKTGKSPEDLKALLDSETWLTAEEAVTLGFANEVAGQAVAVSARGESVVLNRVCFPRAKMPAQILAMAKPRAEGGDDDGDDGDEVEDTGPCNCKACGQDCPCGEAHCTAECACDCDKVAAAPPASARATTAPRAPLALVTPLPVLTALTRSEIEQRAPDVVKALIDEGRTAGIAAERERLKAIDDLPAPGSADLVAAAKYGEQPVDAATLAIQLLRAQQGAGAELLARRVAESAPFANLGATAPDRTAATDQARVVANIVAGGNARRGETR